MTLGLGFLFVVSAGPGGLDHLTPAAAAAISQSDTVVGYSLYLSQIKPLLDGKEVISFEMGAEQARARAAVDLAQSGRHVALVSGGDAGVYGMAGLVFGRLEEGGWTPAGFQVEVVPGVTAATAAAALLGAPLMQDFAVISLSDKYIPWELIARRLDAAAGADLVMVLYEPSSHLRPAHMQKAQAVISRHRPADTPVGIVRDAYRPGQSVTIVSLGEMLGHTFDMRTTIVVGNSVTARLHRWMITQRGYGGSGDRRSPP